MFPIATALLAILGFVSASPVPQHGQAGGTSPFPPPCNGQEIRDTLRFDSSPEIRVCKHNNDMWFEIPNFDGSLYANVFTTEGLTETVARACKGQQNTVICIENIRAQFARNDLHPPPQ